MTCWFSLLCLLCVIVCVRVLEKAKLVGWPRFPRLHCPSNRSRSTRTIQCMTRVSHEWSATRRSTTRSSTLTVSSRVVSEAFWRARCLLVSCHRQTVTVTTAQINLALPPASLYTRNYHLLHQVSSIHVIYILYAYFVD